MKKTTVQDALKELGRIVGNTYGSKGGKKSSANMTPEQRRERALKANEAKRRKKAAQQEGE